MFGNMPTSGVLLAADEQVSSPAGAITATAEHVIHCFGMLTAHFNGTPAPSPQFDNDHCPLFVTWNKEGKRGDIRLRGCIGTLEPRHLHSALGEYALTSAFRDRRFNPVERSELPLLHCSVSLLHSFERAPAWNAWEVGKHGLVIEFSDPDSGARRTATFLPHVAEAEGWDHDRTLESLVRKAGYNGRVDAPLLGALHVTRYQSTAFGMSYREYHDYKAVLDGQRVITVAA